MFNFDEANKKNKEAVDTIVKSYTTVAKGMQAIAAETADYSKKSVEDGLAHFEKLSGVKSVEAALELQTEPPRLYRRPFGLSYAAMAGASSMA